MDCHPSGQATGKLRWECVTDEASSTVLAGGQRENVRARKTLQEGGLPGRDRPIVFRVKEPPLRGVDATSGDCGRHSIPRHSSIDVPKATKRAVALKDHSLGKRYAATAVSGNFGNHLKYALAPSVRDVVKRVATLTYVGEPPDRRPDRWMGSRSQGKVHFTEATAQ